MNGQYVPDAPAGAPQGVSAFPGGLSAGAPQGAPQYVSDASAGLRHGAPVAPGVAQPTGYPAAQGAAPATPGKGQGEVGTVLLQTGPEQVVWRRVHGVTPLVRSWQTLVALVVVTGALLLEFLGESERRSVLNEIARATEDYAWIPLLAVAALLSITALSFYLQWRAIRYAVSSDAVHLHTGVLMKKERALRLTRIQSVDITTPLLGRLFGLGELTVEAAGGGDSNVKIGFLSERELAELRAEILARAAGVKVAAASAAQAAYQPAAPAPAAHGSQATSAPIPAGFEGGQRVEMNVEPTRAPMAPERVIFVVPPGRLIGALLRSMGIWVSVAVLLAVVIIAIVLSWLGMWEVLLAGPVYVLPAALGIAGYFWQRFAGEYNFRAALSPDGIRLQRGLTQTVSLTIPPGRIQAVELSQPFLWRGKDWWRVTAQVAGRDAMANQKNAQQSPSVVLLPVGTREEALYALWLAVPELGLFPGEDPREVIEAGMTGQDEGYGYVPCPRSVRWFNPIQQRRLGVRLAERATLYRSRRLTRSLKVVPHVRLQAVNLYTGPLKRMAGVVSLMLAVANSPAVTVQHVTPQYGAFLQENLVRLSREHRHREAPEQWMARVGVAPQHTVPQHFASAQPVAPHGAAPAQNGPAQ
ncbi:MAG: PH domain-containing protein [Buchananella hordeovulneris]|nr:PH domain-containing protein [Buchananella hordeovulneris]